MNALNNEYILLHCDLEWTKDILKRIDEILKKDNVDESDLEAARWLIKQALKVEKEQ
jgi:hypothetical protein